MDTNGVTKKIMRSALRSIAPDEILDRVDKIGFKTPEQKWMQDLQRQIDSILDGPTARSLPFFRSPLNSELTQEHSWRCICLIRWFERLNVDW
jgi:asparagine synthase (glutamine-hydrolysing)